MGLSETQMTCLPIDQNIAILAANLPDHHRDPADRIIIATAIAHGARLISFDGQFRKYDEIEGLLKKNYGCSHFMVSDDHADPFANQNGNNRFYPLHAAQEILLYLEEQGYVR